MMRVENILLVDDDEAANFLNKKLIEKVNSQIEIHSVLNGREALDYLMNKIIKMHQNVDAQPVIIFLDINMPVMNGFEFLEEINKLDFYNPERMPIVILSSSVNTIDVEKAKLYKIHDYIAKPLTKEKVKEILDEVNVN